MTAIIYLISSTSIAWFLKAPLGKVVKIVKAVWWCDECIGQDFRGVTVLLNTENYFEQKALT